MSDEHQVAAAIVAASLMKASLLAMTDDANAQALAKEIGDTLDRSQKLAESDAVPTDDDEAEVEKIIRETLKDIGIEENEADIEGLYDADADYSDFDFDEEEIGIIKFLKPILARAWPIAVGAVKKVGGAAVKATGTVISKAGGALKKIPAVAAVAGGAVAKGFKGLSGTAWSVLKWALVWTGVSFGVKKAGESLKEVGGGVVEVGKGFGLLVIVAAGGLLLWDHYKSGNRGGHHE